MKPIVNSLLFLGLVSIGLSASAQGTLNFANRVVSAGIDAPIFLYPDGPPIEGGQAWAQLLAGPSGGVLTAIGEPVGFRTGPAAGYVVPTTVVVPGVAPGDLADVQMIAWDSRLGTSWEAALGAGAGGIGMGPILPGVTTGGSGLPPSLPANLTGLVPFALVIVPEPSSWVLGVLGIGVLAMRGAWRANRPARRGGS